MALSQPQLSPAGRRALDAFLAGRLPAGRLQAELTRASQAALPVPRLVLPADTAAIPVPAAAAPSLRRRVAPPVPRAA